MFQLIYLYVFLVQVCESYHNSGLKYANLDCNNGEVLNIIDANYGRQDKTTCSKAFSWINENHLRNTQCVSKSSKGRVIEQCQGKQKCKLPSTNSFFGDPCIGTYKYLQVTYRCAMPNLNSEYMTCLDIFIPNFNKFQLIYSMSS